jgi:predicted O-methyltransferase YrrM
LSLGFSFLASPLKSALRSSDGLRMESSPVAFPNGHFYSPYPSLAELDERAHEIWSDRAELPGIDLRTPEQLELLARLGRFDAEIPFAEQPVDGLRYRYANDFFNRADGITWHTLLRELQPKRVIEVGSGFTSAVLLDTAEHFLGDVHMTFVEPYPERLLSLISDADKQRARLLACCVQDLSLAKFDALEAGDVLFIDSSHVSKLGSDVNHLYFEVLPRLAPGVWVHVHDIFWPFVYPRHWAQQGRAWTESFLLRAFLTFNPAFEIRLWVDYLFRTQRDAIAQHLPTMLSAGAGGSFWMQRTAG